MTLLAGKRLLITGVLTDQSIAYAVAEAAQRQGAEVILTSFGRAMRITQRAARALPAPTEVLELDVTDDEHLCAVADTLEERWGGLDGALHSIAFAPPDAVQGGVVNASTPSLHTAFDVSVFSFQRLALALGPLLADRPSGASLVGLDFVPQPQWPGYDWLGIAKTALRDLTRYLACELGGHGVRVNLIASGPLKTVASDGMPGWQHVQAAFPANAPLGWDLRDATPVADAATFLFSDLSRAVSGVSLPVDGGIHALGGFTPTPGNKRGRARFTRRPGDPPVFDPSPYAVVEETT